MTDKEYRTQKARVLKTYAKWQSPSGMGGWIVSHIWYRDGTAGEDGTPAPSGGVVTARASVAWEYCRVTFHWNLQVIATDSNGDLDRIVRHEICHALVNEMRMWAPSTMSEEKSDEAMKHEEHTVTCLAAILLWCREAGFKGKKNPREKTV